MCVSVCACEYVQICGFKKELDTIIIDGFKLIVASTHCFCNVQERKHVGKA